ncbi:unnamed protein product [Lasius platythorax]|uniref:Uncharacterized protein n=1 Tax=Lasius platythorax TaxID=488582 RepID=A0AAV2P5N5_9HYME
MCYYVIGHKKERSVKIIFFGPAAIEHQSSRTDRDFSHRDEDYRCWMRRLIIFADRRAIDGRASSINATRQLSVLRAL